MAILNTNSTQEASLITGESHDFLTQAVKTKFLNSFESDLDSVPLYIYYGKPTKWDSPSDSPPKPSNSFSDDITVRQNMLALKKVLQQDTKIAFVEHRWEYGTVFNQYDVTKDHTLTANRKIYVFQHDNTQDNYGAVYKCLDNNGGAASTVKPKFDPQSAPVTFSDGYKWKYMFKISAADLSKFQTNQATGDNYIPIVEDTTYKTDAGTIDRIDINSPGTGYTPYSTIPLVDNNTPIGVYVKGDGLEIDSATIKISTLTTNNAIATFSSNSPDLVQGGGYSRVAQYGNWVPVRFEDTGLSDSEINALTNVNRKEAYGLAKINSEGTIDSPGDVIVIDGGSDYTVDTSVKIVQSSTIAYATVASGALSKIKIVQAGKNHRSASVIPVHPTGTGFTGTAQISPIQGHGSDVKKELNANAIFINNRVTATPNKEEVAAGLQTLDFSRTNDFRQVGLLQGPRGVSTVEDSPAPFITDETVTAKYSLIVNEINTALADNLLADTLIVGNQSGAKGRVVDIFPQGTNKIVRYNKTGVSDFIAGENILATGLTGNHKIQPGGVTNPEVDVFTGDVLFINNSEPISRDEDQSETVNFIITF